MRQFLLIIFLLSALNSTPQNLAITTLDRSKTQVTLLGTAPKNQLLAQFNGRQDSTLRKKWTARTFVLADGKILIEFCDRQAALIDNLDELKKLGRIRFVKNTVGILKKNISYKIELSFDEGKLIIQNEKPKRLSNLKSDMPEYFDFEVYGLGTGQILFLDKSENLKSAAIYENLKALCSENSTIEEQLYGSKDDEYLMKRLASGDALPDYEPNDQMIYPKYLKSLIKNHKLRLIEQKVYVSGFYGNLYKSERGYYILVDEANQKNGAGDKMLILDLRIYDSLGQVREAEKRYAASKDKGVRSEHFYQQISDKYGERFPEFVPQLIDSLPMLLNFDKEQLSFDSAGMDLVDEALKWNAISDRHFDTWFPSILAYYGKCYMEHRHEGKWAMYLDKEYKVWIPEVKLDDGSPAWDWRNFYKDLFEGPIPLRWIGGWKDERKKMRPGIDAENNQ